MNEPLVPPDVDLRGLPWMRLDTSRLLDSDLFALSTGDEFKAAVALWCKAWTQRPAGSLPADDRVLAHLSGAGSRWRKVKAMALRGWIECDDGRLYHPVVAEQALAAWDERVAYQEHNNGVNERKRRERAERAAMFDALKEAGHPLPWNAPTAQVRALYRDLSHQPVTPVTVTVTAKTGRDGTGVTATTGETHTLDAPRAPARAREDAPGADPQPSEAGRACRLMREAGCSTANPANPNLLEALAEGVSPETLAQYAALAVANRKTSPFAYAIAAARGDHRQPHPTTGARHAPGSSTRRLSAVERVEANIRRARVERGELDHDDAIEGTATRVPR